MKIVWTLHEHSTQESSKPCIGELRLFDNQAQMQGEMLKFVQECLGQTTIRGNNLESGDSKFGDFRVRIPDLNQTLVVNFVGPNREDCDPYLHVLQTLF